MYKSKTDLDNFITASKKLISSETAYFLLRNEKCLNSYKSSTPDVFNQFKDILSQDNPEEYLESNLKRLQNESESYITMLKPFLNREFNFQKYLDENSFYKSALEKFKNKKLMYQYDQPKPDNPSNKVEPLPLIFFFDLFIANSIQQYNKVIDLSFNIIGKNSDAEEAKKLKRQIASINTQLLTKFEKLTLSRTYSYIENFEINCLKKSMDDYSSSADKLIKLLNENKNNTLKYLPAKKHSLWQREYITNFMVDNYSKDFTIKVAISDAVGKSKYGKRLRRTMDYCQNIPPLPFKINPKKIWKKTDGIIHAEIIADLIAMISGDEKITARQVQRTRATFFKNH